MTTRPEIVAEARTWLGTRFHHQARIKGVGCDCAGLVVGVAKKFGLSDFDKTDYPHSPDGVMLRQVCDREMTPIDLADAQPGDVALFEFGCGPQHLAVLGDYLHGGLSMIHAYSFSRKVVEARFDEDWQRKVVAVYQLPGVA